MKKILEKLRSWWGKVSGWVKAAAAGAILLLGGLFVFNRTKRPPVTPTKARLDVERDTARAEVLDEQADALAPVVEREQAAIEESKTKVEGIRAIPDTATDEEVAAAFSEAGLGKRPVR
jgi:hypothetical protein